MELLFRCFFGTTGQHKLPHIHVKYQDDSAILTIPDGDIIEGNLKPVQRKLVQAWIALHCDELMADC